MADETVRFELHPAIWAGARLSDFPFRGRAWLLHGDDMHFGGLRFHRRETLDRWRTGMDIGGALEVLFPTEFATYKLAKEQQLEAAREDPGELAFEPMDYDFLHWDLAQTFTRGGFELLVLHPQGPDAEFRPVSGVQATGYSLIEIDIGKSRVKLPGCDWLPSLVRFVGTHDPDESTASSISKGSRSTAADETKARKYLLSLAAAGPKAMPKHHYWIELRDRFRRLSRRSFDRAWAAVVEEYPE